LCYTGRTRLSSNILREQTANVVDAVDRVMDSLGELKTLTIEMKRRLLQGRFKDFGELLDVAWTLKRKLASGITNDAIEALYDTAKRAGAIGGKLLGAGGGGYLLLFVPFTRRNRVRAALEGCGGQIVDFQFERRGVRTWNTVSDTWSAQ
jgi:D-glycero-alpha-D-manno-heptose-7-phosphate kinase